MLTPPSNKCEHYIVYFALLPLALAFVALFSCSTAPWLFHTEVDSGIFQYIGYAMLHGKVPYTDMFDHKGLLLYLANAAGVYINEYWGVCLLQGINLWAVCCVWYWGVTAIVRRRTAFVLVCAGLYCLWAYYDRGDYTEEWSLLFQSLPLALFFRRRLQHTWALLTVGMCVGCMALLRLNNAAPVVGLLLYCAAEAAYDRQWRYLGRAAALVFAGFLMPLAAAVAFMTALGGWGSVVDMWQATIVFNIAYATNDKETFVGWLNWLSLRGLSVAVLLLFVVRGRQRQVLPLILAAVIVQLSIGPRGQAHYSMAFVPITIFGFGIMATAKRGWVLILIPLALYLRPIYNYCTMKSSGQYPHVGPIAGDMQALHESHKLFAVLSAEDRSEVWNFNAFYNYLYIYHEHILLRNRMFLRWQCDIAPFLMAEEGDALRRTKPRYVYLGRDAKGSIAAGDYRAFPRDTAFIVSHYRLVNTAAGGSLCLYKLKGE